MKLHKFDALSFIAGLLVMIIGLAFLLPDEPTNITTIFDDFGAWFWPAVLVLVGVSIIAPAIGRAKPDTEEDGSL